MDVKCPICAEPWENETIHDYASEYSSTYAQVAKLFRTKGCGVAFDSWDVTCEKSENSEMLSALADLLGDDLDGYASMVEDFGL
jgi:hypothetical protein